MSGYPDIIADVEVQGPSLGSLKVKYFEEHGFMPEPELYSELLDKHWEIGPLGDEGGAQPSIEDINQAQQPNHHDGHHDNDQDNYQAQQPDQHDDDQDYYQVQQPDYHDDDYADYQPFPYQRWHHEPGMMSFDGHHRLVRHRLDLAPFFGHSPAEIEGGPFYVPWLDPFNFRVIEMPLRLAAHILEYPAAAPYYGVPFLNGPAAVPYYGVPFAHGAPPFPYLGFPVMDFAPPPPDYRAPFFNEAPVDATRAAPTDNHSSPHAESASSASSSRRSFKTKDPWTQAEIDRVVYLREREHKTWDLGTHTAGSISEKYWQRTRHSKGVKK